MFFCDLDDRSTEFGIFVTARKRINTKFFPIFSHHVLTRVCNCNSLGDIFGTPKDKRNEYKTKGIVYKFQSPECTFTYVGQSKRNWKSRWGEHKPGVRPEIRSSITDHAECSGHNVSMSNVKIIEKNDREFKQKNIR